MLPELPVEVWTRVFRCMDPRALVNSSQVCRTWKAAINTDGGSIYREVLLRDKTLPHKERLAYPKKVFNKVERECEFSAHDDMRLRKYRNLARVCVMRTCPLCKRARDMCLECGRAHCEECNSSEKLIASRVSHLNKVFSLPQVKCSWCEFGEFVSKEEAVRRRRRKKRKRMPRFDYLDLLDFNHSDEEYDLPDCYDEHFWECYSPKSD